MFYFKFTWFKSAPTTKSPRLPSMHPFPTVPQNHNKPSHNRKKFSTSLHNNRSSSCRMCTIKYPFICSLCVCFFFERFRQERRAKVHWDTPRSFREHLPYHLSLYGVRAREGFWIIRTDEDEEEIGWNLCGSGRKKEDNKVCYAIRCVFIADCRTGYVRIVVEFVYCYSEKWKVVAQFRWDDGLVLVCVQVFLVLHFLFYYLIVSFTQTAMFN